MGDGKREKVRRKEIEDRNQRTEVIGNTDRGLD